MDDDKKTKKNYLAVFIVFGIPLLLLVSFFLIGFFFTINSVLD
tara:strand:- start:1257 stop:1385 length:129 start_codon:yes stop_codon:yes gene_type:complete